MNNNPQPPQLTRIGLLDISPELAASDACLLLVQSVDSSSIVGAPSSF
jgi:hypothetical protein